MLDDALREQLADWVRPVTLRRLQIMVGRAIAQGTRYTNSVVEFATRTGRLLAVVAPVVTSGFPGKVCVPLWSDPSGEQVMSYCGHGERYDHGRISPVILHVPMYGTNLEPFAW